MSERLEEGQVDSGGLALPWSARLPESPRAALLFVHGLAEHRGRYAHVLAHFAGRGYAAYAFDYRGHGQSPGIRVHVDSFGEFADDVAAMQALVAARHPGLPLALVGHSQGGLIVLHHALRRPQGLLGIVLSSPLLGVEPASRPGLVRRALARMVTPLMPRLLQRTGVNTDRLSHDPAVGPAYRADPLVSRTVSLGWYAALHEAFDFVRTNAGALALPALFLVSPDDSLSDPEATRRFLASAPSGRAEAEWYPGLYHELFNETEPERARVFARVEQWLQARLPPPARAASPARP
ncbi:MAG TPA: alpha/beta hydrolase [Vicinamibacteria bacterium]